MRSILFALLLGVAVAANATPPPPRVPTFGIAEVGGGRAPCAVISGGEPRRGDYVTVVLLSEEPRTIAARLGPETTEPCSSAGVSGTAFLLALEGEPLTTPHEVGLVLDRTRAKVTFLGPGEWRILSKLPQVIRRCTNAQATHLSVTIGEKTVWDQYYHLGYEVEQTCPGISRSSLPPN